VNSRTKGKREWKPVVGFETHYEVSNDGVVRRRCAGRGTQPGRLLVCTTVDTKGYPIVVLHVRGRGLTKKIHGLVARAFLGERPVGKQVNHKDGVKRNNHFTNLEYVTQSQNIRHAISLGLFDPAAAGRARAGVGRKLDATKVAIIREAVASGVPRASLAAQYGIHVMTVGEIVRKEIWRGQQQA
jgi:hypothetical protein